MVISSSIPNGLGRPEIAPEQLAKSPLLSEREKIGEASRQFEAILLRQVLAAAQKTVIPSKFADNSTAAEIYRDLVTNQLADTMSKSGAFGLANTFERQLTRPAGQGSPGAPSTSVTGPKAPRHDLKSAASPRPSAATTISLHPHE